MKTILVSLSFLALSLPALSQDISDIIDTEKSKKTTLSKGNVCYDECRPKKSIAGIAGSKESGKERKECVKCLTTYPELFTMKPEALEEGGYFINIEDESGSAHIRMGEACYNECEPKREFGGVVGKVGTALDRPTCVPCLKKHQDLYKFDLSKLVETSTKCEISADRQYAFCNGDTYKLDNSINNLERSIGKNISEKPSGKKDSSGKATAQ